MRNELTRIRGFLRAVRRRVRLRDALHRGALGAGMVLLMLLGLALAASAFGPASFWLPLTATALGLGLVVTAVAGVWLPRRRLRSDLTAAGVVARLHPPIASDLLSAVELGDVAPPPPPATDQAAPEPPGPPAAISPVLVRAFQDRVAQTIEPLDPRTLVPLRPALRGALVLLAAVVALLVGAELTPQMVGRGLRTLFHRPSRFEGAAVSAAPIVGDVRITYEYPAYTGLAPRTVEGSTGDVVAVKGTRVRIETQPLRKARQAALLLGEAGADGEIPARLVKGTITAQLTLRESGSYRFWLQPLLGRAVREQRSHRLEAEVDRPPRVEIHGPADRLELPTPRPIEVGYAADDDFGLAAVELVYRVGDGPEERQLLKDVAGARTAQGRTVWDPARLELSPGARVAYRVEARDKDQVSGAKAGSSRTLYLTIARPAETVDDRLDRQRAVLEGLISDLGDRLEVRGNDPATPAASKKAARGAAKAGSKNASRPATGASARMADAVDRYAAYGAAHDAEEGHLALLGRMLDEERRAGTLGKALRSALSGVAERVGKLLRQEKDLLSLAALPAGGAGRDAALAAAVQRLDGAADKHILELEKDVLMLDDLIGRQRLEDLANLGRELTDAHRRLEDLMERYAATKDEALRRQIEREIRDLRARIGDMAEKIAKLKQRNEVPEEWRNLPDTKELADSAKRLDEMLARGDAGELKRALAELGKDLQSLRQMLEQNAEGFGAERFPQENRVVAEMMKKIGDLEGDQRTLVEETRALAEKQEAETEEKLRGRIAEWMRKEKEKVDRLRDKLGELKTGDPESALAEEVNRAKESTKQLGLLLGDRDLGEAKEEADRASGSLDRALEHLDDAGKRRKQSKAKDANLEETAEKVGQARQLADEIAEDIRQLLPKPDETLSPEDRERARGQAERQGSIGQRTDETAREAGRRLGKMPGLERAEGELKAAAEQMREAAEHLRKGETGRASGAERNAAERLAKLRDSMQERSMSSGSAQNRDPVRIPGADDSTAPRAWRQELLEAMKEKPPERFRDEVRRYYEELVR
jgi:hypothetical protein